MEEWHLRAALVEAAQGRQAPDLLLRGGRVVNVYSGEILPANVAVKLGRICYVGPEEPAGPETRVQDCTDRFLCPGFIEPHTHPWLLYHPGTLAQFAATRGTTSIACDNLLFMVQTEIQGFRRLVDACRELPARLYWWMRVSPNTTFPGDEAVFGPEAVAALEWPEVLGAAEIPLWPQVTRGEPRLLQALSRALALGKRVDGHTAGASPLRLMALAAAGLSACHEATTGDDALDRLRLGYWTTLRMQPLRPDLPELAAAIVRSGVDTRRMLMTMDGGTPSFMLQHGFMDGCVRIAVAAGLPVVQAIQMVTVNAATYLGLDDWIGGIAPGRHADIQVLPDLTSFQPERVYLGGRLVAAHGRPAADLTPGWAAVLPPRPLPPPSMAGRPELYATPAPPGGAPVPVVRFASTAITRRQDLALPARDGRVDLAEHPDLCYAALLDSSRQRLTRAVVGGLFHGLEGLATTAIGASGMLVLGRSPEAMARAAAAAAEKAGVVLVRHGQVDYHLELPLMGYMSELPMAALAAGYTSLMARAQALGYSFDDLGYSLDFLTAEFLPDIRLTPAGLVETKTGAVLAPAEPLP